MPRGRPKKIIGKIKVQVGEIEEIEKEVKEEIKDVLPDKKIISPLTVDCNREDLNTIVAKVNELIYAFNE